MSINQRLAFVALFFLIIPMSLSMASQRGLSRADAVQVYQQDHNHADNYADNHAVVIGIDKYDYLQPLNYAPTRTEQTI